MTESPRRHPGYKALRATLASLTGTPGAEPAPPEPQAAPHRIDPISPLAHQSPDALRILNLVTYLDEPTVETIAQRLPDIWPHHLKIKIENLVRDGVLAVDADGRVSLAPGVPPAFAILVQRIATALGQREPPAALAEAAGRRPVAFNRAKDGAPLLFGTDARLRNLMALAKHGPMDYRDLRRLTGAGHVKLESADQAPFGRGAQVRVWMGPEFEAIMLDPDYPVFEPLRRLLLKIEESWPLPPFERKHPVPEPPPRRGWSGDRRVIFGSEIPIAILMTVGTLGWTFEALCTTTASGYHRENVKKAMRRLEDDGVLESDRPRRPGFDVRVVTLAKSFPARAELEDLLRACGEAWPSYAKRTRAAIEYLIPKTKAHLRNRGLID